MTERDRDENEQENFITLRDEETGEDVRLEFLDLIEYEGKSYVILLPENDDMVLILRDDGLADDGENEEYASVDDARVLDAVYEIFKERFKDEFNFED